MENLCGTRRPRSLDDFDEDRAGVLRTTTRPRDYTKHRRPMVTAVYREPFALFDSHAYAKGALVLHMLRRYLGEDRFWTGFREYVRRAQERAAGGMAPTTSVAAMR